jgi:hypothetical protein
MNKDELFESILIVLRKNDSRCMDFEPDRLHLATVLADEISSKYVLNRKARSAK